MSNQGERHDSMELRVSSSLFRRALLVSYGDLKRYPTKMLCIKIWPVAVAVGCLFCSNKVKCKMVATVEKCKHSNWFSTSVGMKIACWNV